ncbi:hypothetical protein BB560_007302 [Smittium megazygosporum]|uniref:Uncharacterized protein n=1 Tax=Smittium megazygosporum TaxID=133381 RepID=A0A2T9XX10_9FUNG|nr:hypothetical protein BB560_007302 [Smittium megazygosporum]
MKITIITLILFLYPVFSKYGMLSGRLGQKAILESAMDAAGVGRLTCKVGYIGLDCIIPDSETRRGAFIDNDQENTGLFCQQTTVTSVVPTTTTAYTTLTTSTAYATPTTSTAYATPTTSTAYATPTTSTAYATPTTSTAYATPTTSTAYATPTMPIAYTTPTTSTAYTTPAAPVACPLIVDIQKCMNKCVDDVLN